MKQKCLQVDEDWSQLLSILIDSDLFTKMLKYFQDIISQIVAVEPPALTELTTGVTCPWWTPRTCLWPSPTT